MTDANKLANKVHDRMPVILNPDDYDLWLDPAIDDRAKLERLLVPFPAKGDDGAAPEHLRQQRSERRARVPKSARLSNCVRVSMSAASRQELGEGPNSLPKPSSAQGGLDRHTYYQTTCLAGVIATTSAA